MLTTEVAARPRSCNRLDLLEVSGMREAVEDSMADINDTTVLEPPRVYLVHMVVFTLVVVVLGAILYPSIKAAFMANVGLNGLIIGLLVLGVLYFVCALFCVLAPDKVQSTKYKALNHHFNKSISSTQIVSLFR